VVDSSTEGFALEATGDSEKLDEFIDVMRSYGEIEVTRSGAVAVSLEAKKLRLAPPVPAKRVETSRRKRKKSKKTSSQKMAKRYYEKDGDLSLLRARPSPSSATAARATRTR
jgi:hypothetical protein